MKTTHIFIACASFILGGATHTFASPIHLEFNQEEVYTHNFYSSPSLPAYTISSSGAVQASPIDSTTTLRITVYSPGGESAPSDYKQALDIFYNGSVSMTFRSSQVAGASTNTVGLVSRVQENGNGIAALATIFGGSVQFQFMAVNTQTGSNISGTTFGTTSVSWSGTTLAPANTPLVMSLEVEDLMFKLTLHNTNQDELVSSGWQTLPENLQADYNTTGGVGIRTFSRPTVTITDFTVNGTPIPEPATTTAAALLILLVSTLIYRRSQARSHAGIPRFSAVAKEE